MNQYFPFTKWMSSYTKADFGGDLSAGLTVGVMLIPQGMAYAMLAGLPPIYGLYAATIPLIIYALMGTSRQLAIGPVAMVSILIASGVGAVAELGSAEFIALAILLAFMVGIIQFLLGVFKLGFLVNFLSHPVIAGFTSAAAIIIGFSQLKHLLGLDIPRGKVHETIQEIIINIGAINWISLLIGLGAIVLILMLKRINKRLPSPLIVVLLGLGLVYLFGLEAYGVKIIKDIPGGLPAFALPVLGFNKIIALLPIALTIAFVSFMESFAVAKAIHKKHKDYEVSANQELIALGLANIGGAFFQSFPVTGGFSRSAVNDQAGAKTGVAAMISAGVVILTLLFLTDYFYFLPKAILAAIILVAVSGLIDIKEAKHLWKTDKLDFAAFMITALSTLFLGIEEGILIGIVFSLLLVVYKLAYPHIAELGQVPASSEFRNITRFSNLKIYDHILVLRFDAQLFFANAPVFKDYILQKTLTNKNIKYVVIDASMIYHLDSSAIDMLKDLHLELMEEQIELMFTDVKGPVRDKLHKSHLFEIFGKAHFFLNVESALEYINRSEHSDFNEFIYQYNE